MAHMGNNAVFTPVVVEGAELQEFAVTSACMFNLFY